MSTPTRLGPRQRSASEAIGKSWRLCPDPTQTVKSFASRLAATRQLGRSGGPRSKGQADPDRPSRPKCRPRRVCQGTASKQHLGLALTRRAMAPTTPTSPSLSPAWPCYSRLPTGWPRFGLERSQVVEGGRNIGMIRAQRLLKDGNDAAHQPLGPRPCPRPSSRRHGQGADIQCRPQPASMSANVYPRPTAAR